MVEPSAFPVVSAFRRNFWLVAPVAAAAVITLAVLAPWRDAAPPAGITPGQPVIAQREIPPTTPPPVAPGAGAPTPDPAAQRAPKAAPAQVARVTVPLPDRLVDAAAVDAGDDMNFTGISALAGPESIAVERLADPLPSLIRSIEPPPLQIPALEITALPETPRERREE